MIEDLETIFGTTADTVSSEEGSAFEFSQETLPVPPERLETSSIIVTKGIHGYHGYSINREDMLWIQANRHTFKLLSLLFFAKVFHPIPIEVELRLTHPRSEVRKLILDYSQRDGSWMSIPRYNVIPRSYDYGPEPLQRFPLSHISLNHRFLPIFALTNEEHMLGEHDEEWRARDVVRCAGTDSGNLLFADVLLKLSRPEEPLLEVGLESEVGYGGVGPGSAEVYLYLPGSQGWSRDLSE